MNFEDIITEYPCLLKFVTEQTNEICLEAVKHSGTSLCYVKEQTNEICLEAVKRAGKSLKYVKEQTNEICLEAVKQAGGSLRYVKKQTNEICLEAVKQDGFSLYFVKEQTNEICLKAVKQNGIVLLYVKEQTYEICLEAIKNDINAVKFMKLPFSYEFAKNIRRENRISTSIKKFIKIYCMEKKSKSQIIYIDCVENVIEFTESNDIKKFIYKKLKLTNENSKTIKLYNTKKEILSDSSDEFAYIKKNNKYIIYRKENIIMDINDKYKVTQTTLKKIGMCFIYAL